MFRINFNAFWTLAIFIAINMVIHPDDVRIHLFHMLFLVVFLGVCVSRDKNSRDNGL